MNRVDAHLHLWQLARADYGWLTPALAPLYRDFLPADVDAQLQATGIERCVVVQAAPSEAETRYLFALAREARWIAGVVGWVDFEAVDVAARIAALVRDGNGLLKGLRPMVQDLADADWLARPELDAAFDALVAHGLAFDALVKPVHMPALQARLRAHPTLRVVVDHGGKPDIGNNAFDAWAAGIAALARHPGVHCKLSGLLTEAAAGAGIDALLPYMVQLAESFGPQRLLWGSDWPVLTLRADYAHWLALASALVDRCVPGHAEAVFGANAIAFYRLAQATPPSDSTGNPP